MTLDYIIVIVYLLAITIVGIASSGKINSIHDFSLSNKPYGTFALMATLSASFIGGGFSNGNASKVAMYGIGNIVALCGFSLSVIFIGVFIVPRIKRFTGAKSTGEIMGLSYGKPAQIITGILGTLVCIGILGAQVSAIGYAFKVFLNIPMLYGALIGCGIVILYSSFGGMRAVVITDTIQFLILGIGMPVLLIIAYVKTGGYQQIAANTPAEFYNIFNGYSAMGFISLFLTLALGEVLVPPYTQRLLMGKSLKTTARATTLSGVLSIPFFAVTGLIGLVGYAYFTGNGIGFETNSIMQSTIKEMAPLGVRGILIAGMLSIAMSSADSFLNSAAVSIVNDVVIPLKEKPLSDKQSFFTVRMVNIFAGIASVIFALSIPNILDILTFAYNFWCPVILVPLAATLMGVKASKPAFYASAATGAAVTVLWKYVMQNPFDLDGTVAGFLANLIVFIVLALVIKKEGEAQAGNME